MNDRHAHAVISALLAILSAVNGWDYSMYVSWAAANVFWLASIFGRRR